MTHPLQRFYVANFRHFKSKKEKRKTSMQINICINTLFLVLFLGKVGFCDLKNDCIIRVGYLFLFVILNTL